MTAPIPRSALILAVAGLAPLVWSVATQLSPALADVALRVFGPRFVGPYVGLVYGTIILSFMSGVLWGFATRASGQTATLGYALSVLPALWAFFFVGNGPVSAALMLVVHQRRAHALHSARDQHGYATGYNRNRPPIRSQPKSQKAPGF